MRERNSDNLVLGGGYDVTKVALKRCRGVRGVDT